MDKEELEKYISQLNSELDGTPDHDLDVLNTWGERFRSDPDAEPLMREISKRLFAFLEEEDDELPGQIINDLIDETDAAYNEACRLIRAEAPVQALEILLPLVDRIRDFPLPKDTVWMDFASYLDAMVYQDYFSEFIGGREIGRHPLKPGRILFTLGSLLIEMNQPEEAIEPLKLLSEFDPVCPDYMFELGEAYKRTGRIREAGNVALNEIICAQNKDELARSYRDLAYCMAESGAYDDAAMLYLLSLRFKTSRLAQAELAWIRKKAGISPDVFTDENIRNRCEELEIPIGISETVISNIEFLDGIMQSEDEDEDQSEQN